MPKIIFLTCWYPTKENPAAGIFIKEHAKAVLHTGVDITVIHLNVKKGNGILKVSQENEVSEGIPTTVFHIESIFWKWIYQIPVFFWWIIKGVLKKDQGMSSFSGIEIIHSHITFPAGLIGHKLSQSIGVPHIISEHWSKLNWFFRTSPFSLAVRIAFRQADAVLPVSPVLEEIIRNNCSPLKMVFIVPNVIDNNIFCFRQKRTKKKIVFCAAGVWQKKRNFIKRPDLFIEALGRIKNRKNIDFKLVIAGGGNLTEELKNKCNTLGIESEFKGFLKKNEIAALIQESTYFLHASEYETFGIVVYEALATGTPVIASKLEVFHDLINDSNGILCKNTVEEWEKAIELVIRKEYNNFEISESLREKFSPKAVGESIGHIYKKILPDNLQDFYRVE